MNIEDATSRPSTAQHRAQSKMPKGGPEAWLADVLAQLSRFREVDLMRLGDGTWSPDGEMVIPAPQSILGTSWLHAHDYDEIAL